MSGDGRLRAFYLNADGSAQSIFHVWEEGGAKGDSVTPSTYSVAYRRWMVDRLRELLAEHASPALLGLGCGNAAVEAELAAAGHVVLGVDMLEEAVALARAKGVDAVCADALTWTPPARPWPVIYADGLLGHLYQPDAGVHVALKRFRSWLPPQGGTLLISNDGPRTDAEVEHHPEVPGFAWMSSAYLCRQAKECGFDDVSSCMFTYRRPISGLRERVIVTASTGERRLGRAWDS
ncbi:class I SAM-dependent methyltransferase [Nonomuraea insulae]|uniref:Class I SAM-dependent methyltransferase n=1 Tax=Nonomuraea insulae TaxID=1616787 RepID=A0ABW1CNU3_9ACTN